MPIKRISDKVSLFELRNFTASSTIIFVPLFFGKLKIPQLTAGIEIDLMLFSLAIFKTD